MIALDDALYWPADQAGPALAALARACGIEVNGRQESAQFAPSRDPDSGLDRDEWIESVAGGLGLEAGRSDIAYADVEGILCGASPALVGLCRVDGSLEPLLLVLLRGRGRTWITLLAPDGRRRRVRRSWLTALARSRLEAHHAPEADRLLEAAAVPGRYRKRARASLLGERLAQAPVGVIWSIAIPSDAGLGAQVRAAGVAAQLMAFAAFHAAQYTLWILGWWLLGRAALTGRLDPGWLLGWGLLLLTVVPFRVGAAWSAGVAALSAGRLLRRRLLHGALLLAPDEVRHQGAGELLGRVMDSAAVESLALGGGLLALVSGIELVVAATILGAGPAALPHAVALAAWVVLALLLGRGYLARRRQSAFDRLAMVNDQVEHMVGYRTRLAQEPRERWHEGEDQALERYLASAAAVDRNRVLVLALARGWLILGLLLLAPAFARGAPAAALAVGLGGVLLAQGALEKLASGMEQLAAARVAWEQVRLLFDAATRPGTRGAAQFEVPASGAGDDPFVIEANDVSFRHRPQAAAVLGGVSFRLARGERLLLEGPSGGGKSTLWALLTGLRRPDRGLLLAGGLDLHTLGLGGWRRRVAGAPQFHENHVLAASLAFNLLMARRWPPAERDLEEAERLCRELGLGELLDRMPAGLFQMVGESGWQLSHGERSRIYIARALLQRAELVVLDESLAALDPATLGRTLTCVLERAPTLVVIAHP